MLAFPGQAIDGAALDRFTLAFGSFGDDPFIAPIAGRGTITVPPIRGDSLFADQPARATDGYEGHARLRHRTTIG